MRRSVRRLGRLHHGGFGKAGITPYPRSACDKLGYGGLSPACPFCGFTFLRLRPDARANAANTVSRCARTGRCAFATATVRASCTRRQGHGGDVHTALLRGDVPRLGSGDARSDDRTARLSSFGDPDPNEMTAATYRPHEGGLDLTFPGQPVGTGRRPPAEHSPRQQRCATFTRSTMTRPTEQGQVLGHNFPVHTPDSPAEGRGGVATSSTSVRELRDYLGELREQAGVFSRQGDYFAHTTSWARPRVKARGPAAAAPPTPPPVRPRLIRSRSTRGPTS